VIKSRRIRWEGFLSHIPEKGSAYRVLVGKPEGKNLLEDLGVDWRIKLNGILSKKLGERTVLIWLRIGTIEGSCEHDDEHSVSIQRGEFTY
jgi:hypothetical protein